MKVHLTRYMKKFIFDVEVYIFLLYNNCNLQVTQDSNNIKCIQQVAFQHNNIKSSILHEIDLALDSVHEFRKYRFHLVNFSPTIILSAGRRNSAEVSIS